MSDVIERLEKGELEIVKTTETKIINIGQFKDGKIKIAAHDEMSTVELLRLAKLGQQLQSEQQAHQVLREKLKELEWSGMFEYEYECCPVCEAIGRFRETHKEDCWLSEEINKGR